jgi:hypothetical protein
LTPTRAPIDTAIKLSSLAIQAPIDTVTAAVEPVRDTIMIGGMRASSCAIEPAVNDIAAMIEAAFHTVATIGPRYALIGARILRQHRST